MDRAIGYIRPFGVAAGRDALGPEVARRVRGEMDHETVRINVARAAALVHLAAGIDGLELDAHEYSVMKIAGSAEPFGKRTKLCRAAGSASPHVVGWPRLRDLLL